MWVADSNNRRLKVYDRNLKFKRFCRPRVCRAGSSSCPRKQGAAAPRRRGHALARRYDLGGPDRQEGPDFRQQGVLDGQFSYPNDVSTDGVRRMFVADTSNGRIQVWGWPSEANPIPTPRTPLQWLLCLSPLLLLPLLLLLRRRVLRHGRLRAGYVRRRGDRAPSGRKTPWFVTPDDYEALRASSRVTSDVELLKPRSTPSPTLEALMERFELDYPSAVSLSIAQRSKVFCTEDPELRRLARVIEVDVVNRVEYIERFVKEQADQPRLPRTHLRRPNR